MKLQFFAAAAMAILATANMASAEVVFNEVLGSTTSADTEFIELYNSGTTDIDISNWVIQEVESDPGASNGTIDDSWTISTGTTLAAGEFYLLGNTEFTSVFGITPDQSEALSIENSSYTLVLRDVADAIQYAAFVSDSDGTVPAGITPDISIGPDGTFLPAGYYLDVDGGSTASLLEFSPRPAASATPGFSNVAVPEPSSFGVLALAGLAFLRRKRS
jgi:hypothetical protein